MCNFREIWKIIDQLRFFFYRVDNISNAIPTQDWHLTTFGKKTNQFISSRKERMRGQREHIMLLQLKNLRKLINFSTRGVEFGIHLKNTKVEMFTCHFISPRIWIYCDFNSIGVRNLSRNEISDLNRISREFFICYSMAFFVKFFFHFVILLYGVIFFISQVHDFFHHSVLRTKDYWKCNHVKFYTCVITKLQFFSRTVGLVCILVTETACWLQECYLMNLDE